MGLCGESENTAAAGAALPGMPVNLFALHDGHSLQVGTAKMSEAGGTFEIEAVRVMHNHDLPLEQSRTLRHSYCDYCRLSMKSWESLHVQH